MTACITHLILEGIVLEGTLQMHNAAVFPRTCADLVAPHRFELICT